MSEAPETTANDPQIAADDVEQNEIYRFRLRLFDKHGKAHISWETNCPSLLDDARVHLYGGNFPNDPDSDYVWGDWIKVTNGTLETNKPWGRGWRAALIGRDKHHGAFKYVVKTPVT